MGSLGKGKEKHGRWKKRGVGINISQRKKEWQRERERENMLLLRHHRPTPSFISSTFKVCRWKGTRLWDTHACILAALHTLIVVLEQLVLILEYTALTNSLYKTENWTRTVISTRSLQPQTVDLRCRYTSWKCLLFFIHSPFAPIHIVPCSIKLQAANTFVLLGHKNYEVILWQLQIFTCTTKTERKLVREKHRTYTHCLLSPFTNRSAASVWYIYVNVDQYLTSIKKRGPFWRQWWSQPKM